MVYVGVHMFMCLKEELAWATGKQHWVISIINNISNIYATKELKNKVVLAKTILYVLLCMWSLVT